MGIELLVPTFHFMEGDTHAHLMPVGVKATVNAVVVITDFEIELAQRPEVSQQ